MRDAGVDVQRLKTVLAAEINRALELERLSVRQAQARTGIAAADFSRIRSTNLGRFTIDRLMAIINRLGLSVEIDIRLQRSASEEATALSTSPSL